MRPYPRAPQSILTHSLDDLARRTKRTEYFTSITMKRAAYFACSITLSLGGCTMLPSTGPLESEVAAAGQAGNEVLFDVVDVDDRVVSTLLAQPKESFHARFESDGHPPELNIAVGDTISVTIWESATGGLFSAGPAPQPPAGSRPTTEPLAPEAPQPPTETPAQPIPEIDQLLGPQNQPPTTPFETPFGAPNQMPGAPAQTTPSGQPPSGNIRHTEPVPSAAVEPTSEGRSATIPDQLVAPDGTIGVPFAGRIPAAGRTAEEVQKTIEAALANKALGPQALVIVKRSDANSVTLGGDVVGGARVPLSPGGDRLLQVIAAAAGVTAPIYETFVRLSRGGVTATIPLEKLVADPAENIYAQPADVVTLVRVRKTFSVFGAAGRNATITFGSEKLTLSEALAKSQGLRDDLANPKGVFLFRYEQAAIVRSLGQPMSTRSEGGTSPVAYRFDLSDANSYLLAKQFAVRDKDIIFVADAAAVQVQKLFTLLSSVTGPVITGLLVCRTSSVKC